MRSFFEKVAVYRHKYPVKIWDLASIDGKIVSISYDGSTLRLIDILKSKVLKSQDFHRVDAFSACCFIKTNILHHENLCVLIRNQRNIYVVGPNMNHLAQFDFDVGFLVICLHWVKELNYLIVSGTNGWIRCYKLVTVHKVTHLDAKWNLIYEIKPTSDWITSIAHDLFHRNVFGSASNRFYLWDIDTGEILFQSDAKTNAETICQIYVGEKDSQLVTSCTDGFIKTWNVSKSSCRLMHHYQVAPKGFTTFSIKERSIITLGSDFILKNYNLAGDTPFCMFNLSQLHGNNVVDPLSTMITAQIRSVSHDDGELCVISYKETFDIINLRFTSDNFTLLGIDVNSMVYDQTNNRVLYLTASNTILSDRDDGSSEMLIDLDKIGWSDTRSSMGDVLCFCKSDNIVPVGMVNGAVKIINLDDGSCIMYSHIPITEKVFNVSILRGSFDKLHYNCTACHDTRRYVLALSSKANVHLWCLECNLSLFHQSFGKFSPVAFAISSDQSVLCVTSQTNVQFYRITPFQFQFLGDISKGGTFTISCMTLSADSSVILGSTSGDIQIISYAMDISTKTLSYTLEHHISTVDSPILTIFFDSIDQTISCTNSDGEVYVFHILSSDLISKTKLGDTEPLRAAMFHRDSNGQVVNLAFGSVVHRRYLDTHYNPPEEVIEQEQEIIEVKQSVNEEPEIEIRTLSDLFSTQPRSEVMIDEKPAKSKKKPLIKPFIEDKTEVAAVSDEIQKFEFEMPRPSLETSKDIAERNKKRLEDFYFDADPSLFHKFRPQKIRIRSHDNESRYKQIEFDEKMVVRPFSYSDVPPLNFPATNKQLRVYSQKDEKLSEPRLTTKRLVFGKSGKWAEIASDSEEEPPLPIPSKQERFIIQKRPKTRNVSVVPKKTSFDYPPIAPRVLFDDPVTRNALSFYDPRGFSNAFETAELYDTANSGALGDSSRRVLYTFKERPKTQVIKKRQRGSVFDVPLPPDTQRPGTILRKHADLTAKSSETPPSNTTRTQSSVSVKRSHSKTNTPDLADIKKIKSVPRLKVSKVKKSKKTKKQRRKSDEKNEKARNKDLVTVEAVNKPKLSRTAVSRSVIMSSNIEDAKNKDTTMVENTEATNRSPLSKNASQAKSTSELMSIQGALPH